MNHEKIIKRADKSSVKIITSLIVVWGNSIRWESDVYIKAPRKRIWKAVYSTCDYMYRKLSLADRKIYALNKGLEHVTKEELFQARLELWEKLNPKNIFDEEMEKCSNFKEEQED